MTRGKLDPPNLDDRTWREIVDQARALIPRYAPEWTDHNPSDLGMTLIELFAWLVEGMIYRLNRVPEKNYIAFLNLLGITRAPARPATVRLTCAAGTAMTLPKGSQVATEQTEQSAAVVFETDAELRVLPLNLVAALLLTDTGCEEITGALVTKPLGGPPLELAPAQTVMIALGFDQSSGEDLTLHIARAPASGADMVEATWCYSHATNAPADWPALNLLADETRGLRRSGAVTLRVPAGQWDKQKAASWPGGPTRGNEDRFWIGLRLNNPSAAKRQLGLAHILFNSVAATNALTITQPELLGTSDGTSFQSFELAHRPLFKRPGAADPYDHLVIEVNERRPDGPAAWARWDVVEAPASGPGRCFRLDPVTGTLRFGDHDAQRPDGHGSIPPAGSQIRASAYRYVAGGTQGNVGPWTVKFPRTAITGASVKNSGPASGGADEEALDDTLRRAPELLRGSGRAITAEDYERLVLDAFVGSVKKARCLAPLSAEQTNTYGGLTRNVGHVNLIIVADGAADNRQPRPSDELIWQIQEYLAHRRALTVHLDVVGSRYLPITIGVVIRVWPQVVPRDDEAAQAWKLALEQTTRARIVAFLHPLAGGRQQQGWEIGQDFLIADLLEHIRPESSIGYIETLTAAAGQTSYQRRPGLVGDKPGVWVQVDDFELLCSVEAAEHQVRVRKVGESL